MAWRGEADLTVRRLRSGARRARGTSSRIVNPNLILSGVLEVLQLKVVNLTLRHPLCAGEVVSRSKSECFDVVTPVRRRGATLMRSRHGGPLRRGYGG